MTRGAFHAVFGCDWGWLVPTHGRPTKFRRLATGQAEVQVDGAGILKFQLCDRHKVTAIRLERRFSQEDLAKAIGIHRAHMGGIERGERNGRDEGGFLFRSRPCQGRGRAADEPSSDDTHDRQSKDQ